ncbi:MAG TPA: Flp family type IVb pilin [Candidatus Cybelea sp.]|nr:Flp family type IVb pilin [Candidatus Cybelea sp.]
MFGIHSTIESVKHYVAKLMVRDTKGVTAIEYGLIAGAIAVAIIATVVALGTDINNMFTAVGNALNSTSGGAAN